MHYTTMMMQIATVKSKQPRAAKEIVHARIDPKIYSDLGECSRKSGRSRTRIVQLALADWMSRKENWR